MIGRLRARGAIRRGMGCAAGAVLLLFATSQPHGAAADDTYSATVTVDATADNVAKARDKARLDGQRKAFDAVVAHLSSSVDTSKLAKLSDSQITDLVASFEVANEKMTAVRYTADYTYHFRPTETQNMLTTAGITLTAPNAGTTASTNPATPPAPTPDNTTQPGPTADLVATLPISGLEDWLKLREGLAGLPPVKKVDVKSLSREEASIDIQYVGTLDALKASLATIKLDLEGSDPTWRLAREP